MGGRQGNLAKWCSLRLTHTPVFLRCENSCALLEGLLEMQGEDVKGQTEYLWWLSQWQLHFPFCNPDVTVGSAGWGAGLFLYFVHDYITHGAWKELSSGNTVWGEVWLQRTLCCLWLKFASFLLLLPLHYFPTLVWETLKQRNAKQYLYWKMKTLINWITLNASQVCTSPVTDL